MSIINVVSNIFLLIALLLTSDERMRLRDTKGIAAYGLIALAFILKLTQPWVMMGYNIWLILFLVILIRSNNLVRNMVTGFREELGFWPFLLVIVIGLVGFNLLYEMVRLLLPAAVIVALILLYNTRKTSQR